MDDKVTHLSFERCLRYVTARIAYIDEDGRFVWASDKFLNAITAKPESLTDDERQRLLSTPAAELLAEHPGVTAEDAAKFAEFPQRVLANRYTVDGRIVPESTLRVTPMIGEDAVRRGFLCRFDPMGTNSELSGIDFAEQLPIGYYQHWMNGNDTVINSQFLTTLGFPVDHLAKIGEPVSVFWTKLIHPDDIDRLDAVRVSTSLADATDFRMQHADGTYRWVRSLASPRTLNPDGSAEHVVGLLLDIDDEVNERLELEQALDRAYHMIDSVDTGLISTDRNGIVVRANASACQILGAPVDAVVGSSLWSLLQPVGADDLFLSQLQQRVRTLPDIDVRTADGEIRRLTLTIGPWNDDEALMGATVTLRDLGRDDQRAARRNRAERLHAIGQLASGVAHDFNNYLATICLAAEMLIVDEGLDALTPPARPALDTIRAASRGATSLVSRLLDFDSSTSRSDPVDVHRVIGDVVDIVEVMTQDSSRVVVELGAQRRLVIGNRESLSTALLNLGINARQAMGVGTITFRTRQIELDADDDLLQTFALAPGPYLEIEVADNGPGIPPEIRDRLFEPFVRRGSTGHGLGLAQVHATVINHGGGVELLDTPGGGTTVRIVLPEAPHEPVFDVEADRETARLARADSRRTGKVLLVEDNEALAGLVMTSLGDWGYEPTWISRGDTAMEAITESPKQFDVVVADQRLPGLTGGQILDATRRLRPDLPFVIIGGSITSAEEAELLEAGAQVVIHKPLTGDQLLGALESVLPPATLPE